LALDALEHLLDTADLAAAMTLDAFAGRSGALRADVHALRPHPGQVATAAHVRELLAGSTLMDIPYHLVPRFKPWVATAWVEADDQALSFDIGWDWVPASQRHGREAFYRRFMPFRGGKKHQPQDAYSLRCMPQVHGAVRDAWAQACRVIDIELNSVTDNPLVFPENADEPFIEDQVISAGHFHGMPLALVMSYVKAAIPVLASISERRLNKLVDPATNDGLPAFLTGNEDGTDSGFMIVQYTAAALVNDLATRAHPACVYSIPTSANAEDHVSMGANEARQVLEMTEDLAHVLALELYTAAQALEYRETMLDAAQRLARRGGWQALAAKVDNAPREGHPHYAQFVTEVQQLAAALTSAGDFHAGASVRAAHAQLRKQVAFLHRDRALDVDIRAVCALVDSNALLQSAAI
jgi:histidine ammonia-lyase